MKTIVITSQKGGSGKTTLVTHLSVEAERCGDGSSWIIDTDAQATMTKWHGMRKNESPHRLDVPFNLLATGLEKARADGGAYCFIDTAPTIGDQIKTIILSADLVIIPVRPSPADLWAVGASVKLVKDAGKPFIFAITQAKPQAAITAQAVAALSQHGRVAQSFVTDRVGYAAAINGGQTVSEISQRSPAAEEIAALWAEIKTCFNHPSVRLVESNKERSVVNG